MALGRPTRENALVTAGTDNRYPVNFTHYRTALPPRFFAKIKVDIASGCWNWIGATGFHPRYRYHRYGQIVIWHPVTGQRRLTTAHKFAYLHVRGDVPAGYDIHHVCENKLCVNPEHLEAITHKENIRRIRRGGQK